MQPQAPGQHPGQGGEDGTVSPVPSGVCDLTSQDRDLMAEDQDLRILDGVTAGQQRQPAKHLDHELADEAYEHERRS